MFQTLFRGCLLNFYRAVVEDKEGETGKSGKIFASLQRKGSWVLDCYRIYPWLVFWKLWCNLKLIIVQVILTCIKIFAKKKTLT